MQIIKDGKIVQDDWKHVADDEALPKDKFSVSFKRFQSEKIEAENLGLRLLGEDPIAELADELKRFALIVIELPVMANGRAFSVSKLLRDRYGFTGEIRVKGHFIKDQIFFFSRVGVNSFEAREDQNLEALLPGLQDFTVKYQASADEKLPLYRRR